MLWDVVQVKIQSPGSKAQQTRTHEINLNDIRGDDNNSSSLILLQQSILQLVTNDHNGGSTTTTTTTTNSSLELQLSLSYLSSNGELVPLTTQKEWDDALHDYHNHHPKNNTGTTTTTTTKSKSLLVLAQVMQPHHNNTGTTNGSSSTTTSNNVEERLARMEELLVAFTTGHNNNNNIATSSSNTPSRCLSPTTGGSSHHKDYTAIVKDHQASLTTRLNKVKLMNSTATTPTSSIPNSPARFVHHGGGFGSGGGGNAATSNNNEDSTATTTGVWMPRLADTTTTSSATTTTTGTTDPNTLQDFLERMIRERYDGMQQIMESRAMELQTWQQSQKEIQAAVETELQDHRTTVQKELEHHKSDLLALVTTKLEKLEQHRLVAHARDAVAIAQAIDKATNNMQSTLQQQLSQIIMSSHKSTTSSSTTSAPPPVSSSTTTIDISSMEEKLQSLSTSVQERLDSLEKMVQETNQTSKQSLMAAASVASATAASSSSSSSSSTSAPSPLPPTSSSSSSSAIIDASTVQTKLDALQQQMETSLVQRFQDLEQRLQQQHLRQMNLITDASVSNSLDVDVVQAMERNILEAITTTKATTTTSAGTAQAPEPQQSSSSSPPTSPSTLMTVDPAIMQELSNKMTQLVQSSQDTILHNEKQYASALRQSMIRLHKETQNEIIDKVSSKLKKMDKKVGSSNKLQQGNTATTDNNNNNNNSASIDAVNQIVSASHDDLRTGQAEALEEHKKYLVECIELAQRAMVAQLMAGGVKTTAVPSGNTLEERLVNQMEQIQAQATASILDKVDHALARRQRWTSTTGGTTNGDKAAVTVEDDSEENGVVVGDAVTPMAGAATASTVASTAVGGERVSPLSHHHHVVVGGGDAVTMEQMEELIFNAMEKLETAVETNSENIQAQATAVILEQVESSQGAIFNKVESSRRNLQETIETSQANLLKSIQNQKQHHQHMSPPSTQQWHQSRYTPQDASHQRSHPPQQARQQHQQQPPVSLSASLHAPLQALQQILQPSAVAAQDSSQQRQQQHHRHDQDRTPQRKNPQQSRIDMFGGTTAAPAPSAPSGLDMLYGVVRPTPSTVTPAGGLSSSRGRPRADGQTVKRFLDMETRSYRLETAYDCIKHNKNIAQVMSVDNVPIQGEEKEELYNGFSNPVAAPKGGHVQDEW